jgi:hypothetical protein
MTAEEAGGAYRLPAGLEEWTLFNPGYFARAIGAWMEELGVSRAEPGVSQESPGL